jgi:hypothetical protein
MGAQAWQCLRCRKLYPLVGERRSQEGHLRGICLTCSTIEAEEIIDHGHRALGWYVDWLKTQIKSRDAEIREEARYSAAMAADAEYERRGGSW